MARDADGTADAGTRAPAGDGDPGPLLDRARYGVYPPGSAFKIVTATAALRKDPALVDATFTCETLPGGRVGRKIPGWGRPIRDDPADKTAHGTIALERGLVVSCNAYFAQLGLRIGADALRDAAGLYEIPLGQPETPRGVRDTLPYAAYGQGQVLATPFKMARVAATIASGGSMPQGRWIVDDTNRRAEAARAVLTPAAARTLAVAMRKAVLEGTGRSLKAIEPADRGQDRDGRSAGRAVSFLVRRVRAVRIRPRSGSPSPSSWSTAATARAPQRPSPGASSRRPATSGSSVVGDTAVQGRGLGPAVRAALQGRAGSSGS